jgi:glycosyltransferase involved in cell wall biosynthesis
MEFQGFSNTLTSQGVPPPIVVECQLPDEPPTRQDAATGDTASTRDTVGRPLVLSVGSLEPRKNHLALLHAAETLWREGLDFELQLIGGSVWGDELQDRIAELKDVGRPLTVSLRVSEAELAACYGRARFSVFASLHEGYGLPVAESLAAGVPAITSGFGSMAEIASAGGALTVNPRDDRDLTAALRRMISDDALIAQLKDEITRRPQRSWNDYAAELWDAMVAPELANDTA